MRLIWLETGTFYAKSLHVTLFQNVQIWKGANRRCLLGSTVREAFHPRQVLWEIQAFSLSLHRFSGFKSRPILLWIFQKVHKRSIAFSLKWGSIVPAYNYPSGLCSAGLQKLRGLKVSSMMMTREAEQLSRWCPLGCHITHALPQTKGSHLKPNSRAKPYYCRQNIQWRKIVLKMFVVFHMSWEKCLEKQ